MSTERSAGMMAKKRKKDKPVKSERKGMLGPAIKWVFKKVWKLTKGWLSLKLIFTIIPPMGSYSRSASWISTRSPRACSNAVCRAAVTRSGFLEHLQERFRQSGKTHASFAIAIKPNFMIAAHHEVPPCSSC